MITRTIACFSFGLADLRLAQAVGASRGARSFLSSMATKPSRNRPSWADLTDTDDEHEKDGPKELHPGFVPEVRQEALQATAEVPKVNREDVQVHDKKGEKDEGWPQKLATSPRPLPVPQSSAVVTETPSPSHECQESPSYAGPPANMWIFEKADPGIHVKAWLGCSHLVMKKGENMCLRLATVCPRDREASLCIKCQQPCRHHHRECKYKGQIPCAWCNRFVCKHAAEKKGCSRRNFGCNFCHYDAHGHCVPSPIDVQKYPQLNSLGHPWPSWPWSCTTVRRQASTWQSLQHAACRQSLVSDGGTILIAGRKQSSGHLGEGKQSPRSSFLILLFDQIWIDLGASQNSGSPRPWVSFLKW